MATVSMRPEREDTTVEKLAGLGVILCLDNSGMGGKTSRL
jgi:hypothetical protein